MNDVLSTAETSESEPARHSVLAGLSVIYRHMSARRRRQFFAVLLLMVGGAIAEIATIGAVIPFIALLAKAGEQQQRWLALVPGPHSGIAPLLITGAAFIAFAIVAGLVRFQLAMESRNFIFRLGHELIVEIQRRVLLQPYSFHIHRNTSTLLTAVEKTEFLMTSLLMPLMQGVTGGVIAICVTVLLVAVAPLITVAVAACLVITYALFSAAFRKRLAANSLVLKTAYDERMQVIQESLGGIREVIIDGSQSMYLDEFARIDSRLADARTTTQLIFLAPHYLIEMVGMVLIAAIALITTTRSGGITDALPVLAMLALGAQRLLPLVQDVYRGWSGVEGNRPMLDQVVGLLSLPADETAGPPARPFALRDSVKLDEVTLIYPTRRSPALDRVSLAIPRGSMVAVVGPTGSGKSTLVDLLMGLLQPSEGRILIDDVPLTGTNRRRWHRSIAHVPQAIFLGDTTIEKNIALSLPRLDPDRDRIIEAAKKAQLHDFVLSLPNGYETYVGERGVRLSGGQRQRLGIARAIYKDAPILVLDEATSALDDRTEAAVISALETLKREGRTMIIVAHRLSTIRQCDLVAALDGGRLVDFGPRSEVLSRMERLS